MVDRQIVLDTETTGLEHHKGHRIIEIGCVELINRKLTGNNYHQYLNPEREIDVGAMEVHGITNEFLQDAPLFADTCADMIEYLNGAELIIHNAPFDVGFLNAELARTDNLVQRIEDICTVHDTLVQARQMFPGQRNDLDSLCKRYDVNNTHRELHGALLDAEILADVYLEMTGGQTLLSLDVEKSSELGGDASLQNIDLASLKLPISKASPEELELHRDWLKKLDERVDGKCVWTRLNEKSQQ